MKTSTRHLICAAAILPLLGFTRLRAEPVADNRPSVIATSANTYESEAMAIAPKCVSTTVGLVGTIQNGNTTGVFSGSGVLVSADGLILTAGHVAQKPGTPLNIRFADGRVVQGVSLGIDHLVDTGMVRITDAAPEGGWPFAPMAAADSARFGEWVLATGNPGSIVIGRNPPIRLGRVTGHEANAIQTNCAMEPGDSGGPLFDLSGRVIGINSRIMTAGPETLMRDYVSVHVPIGVFARQWKWLLAKMNAHPDANLNAGPQPGRRRQAGETTNRLKAAVEKLAGLKDPEAMKLLADSKKNGRAIKLSPEQSDKLIRRANWAGPATRPANELASANAAKAPATTQPSATTQPAGSKPKVATTQPAKLEKGIPLALRPIIGPQIKKSLLRRFPNAKISDELLSRILDKSSFDLLSRHMNIATDQNDLKAMGLSDEEIASKAGIPLQSARLGKEVSKSSLQTLALFSPALDAAGDCFVEIRAGDKTVLLGTIVDPDGWIVTKASDLPEHPMVLLPSGKTYQPKLIGKDNATDLALLKIEAHDLSAVKFAADAPLGEWLASPTADPDQPEVGVVSLPARPIPEKFNHFLGEHKIRLGVGFSNANCVIGEIMPGMPAAAAGVAVGDKVLELDGTPVSNSNDFIAKTKLARAGQTLTLKIRRGDKELELKLLIGEAKSNTQTNASVGEADNFADGKLSKRRTNFPMAIQTDCAIWSDQCGGPVINLHGQTIGINIARYDRVCTFAIPADLVQKTVAKLRAKQGQ
ncbi:MAG TPA: trypsin-like peptidase domain-containing protein [Tepidisphaeraceae bacterium]|jgi:S1-C subfamily serine protease|nr:trypsin-like peptidase domain-containing protein [Tepidisphaeraceae bacterium]